MQGPTEEAEASIPTVKVEEDPNLNVTIAVRRKAAKRTLPWALVAGELDLVSSSPPQAEDMRATKKPRLEEPFFASADEADTIVPLVMPVLYNSLRNTCGPSSGISPSVVCQVHAENSTALPPFKTGNDTAVSLPTAAAAADNADEDPMKGIRAMGPWKPEEDAKLTIAVTNTAKKKWGKEYVTDWVAITALVPGRTKNQCYNRWQGVLDCSIDRATKRKGRWTEDEDSKLKNAVQTHGAKNWVAIAVMVPGRTNFQCNNRWQDILDCSIDRATKRKGRWTAVEDSKLKDAVQTHGEKDWAPIAALVPGRTRQQCYNRWRHVLDPSIDRANERAGRWTVVEDSELKDAVKTHGGKDWVAIAALVPGRTQKQCYNRWFDVLDCSIDRANGRTGKWEEDEDSKLKNAVQTQGDKDWDAISSLVPGRTHKQCSNRWQHVLDANANANRRTGKWAEDEDIKLTDAVQTHGSKNWITISGLVPGRSKKQCSYRWKHVLDPSIDRASGRSSKWVEDDVIKLKSAIQTHGDKDWVAAGSALVPGPTKCRYNNKGHAVLEPNIGLASTRKVKWTAVEDSKLKDAVQTHGGKNWAAIATLLPGRTKSQCSCRWHDVLLSSTDGATACRRNWTAVEDDTLKDAVQTRGELTWDEIAALVPGRTKKQCCSRWHRVLNPNIGLANGRWTAVEDGALKYSTNARWQELGCNRSAGSGSNESSV
jgi:hypothetical protein